MSPSGKGLKLGARSFWSSHPEREEKWGFANIAELVQECLEMNIRLVHERHEMNGPLPLSQSQR